MNVFMKESMKTFIRIAGRRRPSPDRGFPMIPRDELDGNPQFREDLLEGFTRSTHEHPPGRLS